MSKTSVKVELYRCDFKEDDGVQCELEGERQQMRQCAMCNMDLCSRHYQTLSVTNNNARYLTYFFCENHSKEFITTLIKTFGDTTLVDGGGMAK